MENDLSKGFCNYDETWCAVPYAKGQFIIIHQGSQVRTCKSLETALKFIGTKNK